ncbi:MAG: hypothetical protein WB870_07320 [Gallionellaceae bacterium]
MPAQKRDSHRIKQNWQPESRPLKIGKLMAAGGPTGHGEDAVPE